MGDDFAYENANTWFKQIDKLIHYVNMVLFFSKWTASIGSVLLMRPLCLFFVWLLCSIVMKCWCFSFTHTKACCSLDCFQWFTHGLPDQRFTFADKCVGWPSQRILFYPINIRGCCSCCKRNLASENRWLLPVKHFFSAFWLVMRVCNYIFGWSESFLRAYTSDASSFNVSI